MLLDFDSLVKKYNLRVKGVIHIGAHHGEEHPVYARHNITNVAYFEPDPTSFQTLQTRVGDKPGVTLFNTALGNRAGEVVMNVASNGGVSSSILTPNKHLTRHPKITFDSTIRVALNKLDNIPLDRHLYNMINIDVQGYELEVFKGGAETLKGIEYIMAEVNRDEVYDNCVHVEDLDIFLNLFNFIRVETIWSGGIWGDAFYVKKPKHSN